VSVDAKEVFTMRVSRTTGAVSGLAVVVLGVWGGLIPFIGPYFHYSFGSNDTWHYSANRMWLDILPGGAAVAGGLMMIYARTRIGGIAGGWLGLAAGAWFVVGAPVSHLWRSGATAAAPIGAPSGSTSRATLELVGYFYGVGVLIVACSAFAIARFVSRPALVEPAEPAPRATEPAAEGPTEPLQAPEPVGGPVTEPEPIVEPQPESEPQPVR